MEPTDIELMLRARQDDLNAFHLLTQRYREPLRRFFSALVADRSQADDYVQETFLRLWLLRARYEPTGRFSTYLFQIARHYWLNQRKKFRAELAHIAAPVAEYTVRASPASEPERILLERLRTVRIHRAIAALPEHYLAVFTLSHIEGLKYAEIASRLAIPVGTVKSRMAEATRRLRIALGESDEGA